MTPLPPQNQQAGTDRFPIPMYSGKRNSLSRFLKHFYTWVLSSQSEDALIHSRPIIMTGDSSRRELERKYGRQIVAQLMAVWNGSRHRGTSQSSVRGMEILKRRVEDDSSERAKEQAKKNFEGLSMNDAENMKEYIARANSLALNVQDHDIEASEQEISRRVLNGPPPPCMLPRREILR